MNMISVNSRIVESGIALSILVSALLNLKERKPHNRVGLAFFFGLLHGLGFASALAEEIGRGASVWTTLASFNVGVEIGQLLVLCAIVPLLYLLSRKKYYETYVLRLGSIVAALFAAYWVVERAYF